MFFYSDKFITIEEVSTGTTNPTYYEDLVTAEVSLTADMYLTCPPPDDEPIELPEKIKHNFDKPIGKRCPVGGHQPIEVKHLKRYYT